MIMGLPEKGSHMGAEPGRMLGGISEYEALAGHPMLSTLAVGVRRKSGPGFFGCAKALGRFSDSEDETSFWLHERERVYGAWHRAISKKNSLNTIGQGNPFIGP